MPPFSNKRAPILPILPILDTVGLKRIQGIVGTLLYYARALDSTMLMAIGSISSAQANGTEATAKAVAHLLDYCATHPEATIKYRATDMILCAYTVMHPTCPKHLHAVVPEVFSI
eukprot:scaffold245865_cov61-Attheya_sp.AAC.1